MTTTYQPDRGDHRSAPTPTSTLTAGWERPALAALLVATAALYLWALDAGGWANSYYSAAVQAGSESWKAWFFGSFDAANAITVDKPPASLWLPGLSVRLFGLNSWSLLAPQALMGVGTVAVVYASVRRWFSAPAALTAGAIMATTPVAALMFRFNNPDALLTLLLSLATYLTLRAVEDGRRRWVVAAGAALGFAFLTKQLQMALVIPALTAAYLLAAPHSLARRVVDVGVAMVSVVVSASWWLAIVELWPADSRPYIGGSQTNSILELTLGYNGLGRLTGEQTGSVGGGGGNQSRWGETGITRLIDGVVGGQIAWLLPAALIGAVAGLWLTRRSERTDVRRAAIVAWGGTLLTTAVVFSFMEGIFHEYYTVALAPPIAVLVAIGAEVLWRNRHRLVARATMAATVAVSTWWAVTLVGRADDWNTWLIPTIAVSGALAVVAIVASSLIESRGRSGPAFGASVAGLALVALLAGPTAWSIETVAQPETGSIVTAGPAVEASVGGPGARPDGTGTNGPGGDAAAGGLAPPGDQGGQRPVGGQGGSDAASTDRGGQRPVGGQAGSDAATGGQRPDGGQGRGGGVGGLLDSAEVGDEVVAVLTEDADDFTWAAAAVGANRAAGFQLASEEPVMAIGGFNGSDPAPTLAQFQELVADGQIHWFIAGGGFGPSTDGSDDPEAIAEWVTANFEATTVGGVTLYDLGGEPDPA